MEMTFKLINPESLGAPQGYANGVLAEAGGRLLFIAGQVAWDQQQQIVSEDLVEQFDQRKVGLEEVRFAAEFGVAGILSLAE